MQWTLSRGEDRVNGRWKNHAQRPAKLRHGAWDEHCQIIRSLAALSFLRHFRQAKRRDNPFFQQSADDRYHFKADLRGAKRARDGTSSRKELVIWGSIKSVERSSSTPGGPERRTESRHRISNGEWFSWRRSRCDAFRKFRRACFRVYRCRLRKQQHHWRGKGGARTTLVIASPTWASWGSKSNAQSACNSEEWRAWVTGQLSFFYASSW